MEIVLYVKLYFHLSTDDVLIFLYIFRKVW